MKQLTAKDLVVGNKYVPHSKSWHEDDTLEDSVAWQKAQAKGQPYLYYVGVDEDGGECMFWWEYDADGGDYFLPSDVTPYIEPGARKYESPAELSEVKWDESAEPKDFLPFNLEEALKSPERVVYRNGEKPLEWHYLKSSKEVSRKIISVTPLGHTRTHAIGGYWNLGDTSKGDLLLLPLPKTTYWINVMEEEFSGVIYITGPWRSEAEAFQQITMPDKCIKTITFEV